MKIVHICLLGPFSDNRSYQENLLAKYHKKLGHDVTVITSKWVQAENGQALVLDERRRYQDQFGVDIIRLRMRFTEKPGKIIKKYAGLYETLQQLAPDFIFIHGVSSVENKVLVHYLKRHPSVRAKADNHADYSNSATNALSKYLLHGIIWRHYAKMLSPVVEQFYGVLPARVDFLVERYKLPASKCSLLVMGGDDEKIAETEITNARDTFRREHRIDDRDFLLVTGGKIDAWKTQTLLLMEAVQKLQIPAVKLVIFGSVAVALRERFNEMVDGDKVRYIGWIQADDTYACFAAADLVVFPGRHSVFWEQVAAQGIPMLCKDWPGTHHIDVGGNVVFLQKDSAEEMAERIQELYENRGMYQKMKACADKEGRNRFSYLRIAKEAISDRADREDIT